MQERHLERAEAGALGSGREASDVGVACTPAQGSTGGREVMSGQLAAQRTQHWHDQLHCLFGCLMQDRLGCSEGATTSIART